jgi:hypothetical protein
MSFDNSPADNREMILERLRAQAEVDRASRLAGHKSLLRRVLGMSAARLSVPFARRGKSFGRMAATLAPRDRLPFCQPRSFRSRDAMVVLNVAHA